MTAITPEGLRELADWIDTEGAPAPADSPLLRMPRADIFRAHAAALEELARLKAPVEVAGIVARLRDHIPLGDGDEVIPEAAAALESLAAQVAGKDDYIRQMVEKAADNSLDGYRELGAKCAALEEARERAEAESSKWQNSFHEMTGKLQRAEAQLAEAREANKILAEGGFRCAKKNAEVARENVSLHEQLAERDALWTDENGTAWRSPTAWSYAMTCRALNRVNEQLAERDAELAAIFERAQKLERQNDDHLSAIGALQRDCERAESELAKLRATVSESGGYAGDYPSYPKG